MKLSTIIISVLVLSFVVFGTLRYTPRADRPAAAQEIAEAQSVVESVPLPINWGNKGSQLQKLGVIDRRSFDAVYASRGGMSTDTQQMLDAPMDGQIVMTKENANEMLNVFWAFGLANKNKILEKGPMMDARYNGAGNFASTGGWSLAVGDPMSHYSMHQMITLTPDQQLLVERVSKNIYRPCCNNSTYFPDCNHGMAMLGLLELMAAQNVSEQEMYKTALAVNRLWFPDQYEVIGQYLGKQNKSWANADPKEILSAAYSSGSGYAKVVAALQPKNEGGGGGSCGV